MKPYEMTSYINGDSHIDYNGKSCRKCWRVASVSAGEIQIRQGKSLSSNWVNEFSNYRWADSDNDRNGQAVEKQRKCNSISPILSPRKTMGRDETAKSKQSQREKERETAWE